MKTWPIIRRFPKFAIVAGIWIGSALIFGIWWWMRSGRQDGAGDAGISPAPADHRADTLPDRMGRLILADGDLYDAGNGELIYKDWLHGDQPGELFYEADKKRVVGKFDGMMIRYRLDGTREMELKEKFGLSVFRNRKEVLFARDHDLWRADLNWDRFTLGNERKITSLGNLNEQFMLQNIILTSDTFLVLKNQNQFLRINAATGETVQVRLPLNDLKRGRSPDGEVLLGDVPDLGGRKIFAYNLETDSAVFEAVGRRAVTDYTWITPDRCLLLMAGDMVISYDRKANSFSALCRLPVPAMVLRGPSPDGGYVFAANRKGISLIDVAKGTAEPFKPAGENFEWVSPDTLLASCSAPDSGLRGTWIHKIGKEPKRILPEPYSVTRDGVSAMVVIPEAGWVVFGASDLLYRVDFAGENLKELGKLAAPRTILIYIASFIQRK